MVSGVRADATGGQLQSGNGGDGGGETGASRKDIVNDVAFDVGQAKIAAGVAVGETLVVEAEEF